MCVLPERDNVYIEKLKFNFFNKQKCINLLVTQVPVCIVCKIATNIAFIF